MERGTLETLVTAQIAPLPDRQITERHFADAHAPQASHLQSDQFAHAPDLALLAFTQNEAQLILVLPGNGCPLECRSIKAQAEIQLVQAVSR